MSGRVPRAKRVERHPSWKRTNGRCYYCGLPAVVLDHVRSLRDGGTDDPENLIPACWRCNCAKAGRSVDAYRAICRRVAAGAPLFTAEQLAYLDESGIVLPELPPYVFWGEAEGLGL
jgi:hypothetical protein